jgi:hypothetical protein
MALWTHSVHNSLLSFRTSSLGVFQRPRLWAISPAHLDSRVLLWANSWSKPRYSTNLHLFECLCLNVSDPEDLLAAQSMGMWNSAVIAFNARPPHGVQVQGSFQGESDLNASVRSS